MSSRTFTSTMRAALAAALSLGAACAYDASSVLEPDEADAAPPSIAPVAPDGGVDQGPPHGSGIEALPGTWHSCSHTLTIRKDGTSTSRDLRRGCTTEGTWTDRGDGSFDMVSTPGGCEGSPAPRRGIRLEFTSTGLLLVHPSFSGGHSRLYADSQPRSRWALEATPGETGFGNTPGRSVVSIVGEPGRGGVGCYWSAEGECGGAFSCGGSVHDWDVRDGVLRAGLNCSGDCPCGSTMQGSVTGDRIEGTFRALNCSRTWEGTFSAVRSE